MRRKVTEVSQIDPDEQKKRKRQEEAEEEDPLKEILDAPATPASQVTPFSLEKGKKKTSPLEMQGGPGISPMESAQKATLPFPPTAPFFQVPSSDEMADDSGMLEEESFIENVPSPSPEEAAPPPPTLGESEESLPAEQPAPQAPFQPPQSQPPQVSETATPQAQQPLAAGLSESSQSGTGKHSPEKKPTGPPERPPPGKKTSALIPEPKLAGLGTEQQRQAGPSKTGPGAQEKLGTTAAAMEGAQPSKVQDTTGFFEQFGEQGGEKKGGQHAETPEELEEEAEIQGVGTPGQPPPFVQASEEKEEKKIKERETPADVDGLATTGIPGEILGATTPSAAEPLPSYAHLHPQVMEIFDRMVGVMTVMSMSGMTETVITLNSPQFASSVFFGSQIIIQEFSTAPQAFNIQLNGTPQAVELFQGNADDLMAAFQAGNYNFRINRLETGYLTERPLFKRKEKAGEKDGDTGESPK
jgi:hypothetical protein